MFPMLCEVLRVNPRFSLSFGYDFTSIVWLIGSLSMRGLIGTYC